MRTCGRPYRPTSLSWHRDYLSRPSASPNPRFRSRSARTTKPCEFIKQLSSLPTHWLQIKVKWVIRLDNSYHWCFWSIPLSLFLITFRLHLMMTTRWQHDRQVQPRHWCSCQPGILVWFSWWMQKKQYKKELAHFTSRLLKIEWQFKLKCPWKYGNQNASPFLNKNSRNMC